MIPAIANSIWLGSCLPEYLRFRRSIKHVAREQAAVLHNIISANAGTEFGRMHSFSAIRSVRDFQGQVPVRDYDGHQHWITQTAGGEKNILTAEEVRLFEPTSGSTGDAKLIPYTASLQQQFRRGIQAWIADLFLHHLDLMTGRAYWSVSPVVNRTRHTSGGIPIAFDDDTAYLGGCRQWLVEQVMAAPGALGRLHDMESVRYLTLLFLVRCRNLKLLSAWNPSFLSLLMEYLPQWGEEIARDIENGTASRGSEHSASRLRLHRDQPRAQDLRSALRLNTAAERHVRLWPELRLISCWMDANAAAPAARLQALFPQSKLQGKGLLATEGLISFPLVGHQGAALAVRSHFMEFFPMGPSSQSKTPQLAHELLPGRKYGVVITTGGGLYRYQTGDTVEVTGHVNDCPLIRFVGRHDRVSDWFGEKLSELHVAGILRQVFDQHGITPAFGMLACDTASAPVYVLYIQVETPDDVLDRVARNIEDALCGNFHYHYARQLGQLGPLKVFRARHAAESYLANAIACGQRAGNVKPPALDKRNIWSKVFDGYFVSLRYRTDVTDSSKRNSKTENTQNEYLLRKSSPDT